MTAPTTFECRSFDVMLEIKEDVSPMKIMGVAIYSIGEKLYYLKSSSNKLDERVQDALISAGIWHSLASETRLFLNNMGSHIEIVLADALSLMRRSGGSLVDLSFSMLYARQPKEFSIVNLSEKVTGHVESAEEGQARAREVLRRTS